jgi:hypothetical protein
VTDDPTFTTYCKMTCIGGSEAGTCPCKSPVGCELQAHPDYERERERAKDRMMQWLRDQLENPAS